jgi:hypothetical protein
MNPHVLSFPQSAGGNPSLFAVDSLEDRGHDDFGLRRQSHSLLVYTRGDPASCFIVRRATRCVMARINLTLDRDTCAELEQHAKQAGKPRARVVKELLVEALQLHVTRERRRQLARDYAAGRVDARALLSDVESGQLDLLGDEDA